VVKSSKYASVDTKNIYILAYCNNPSLVDEGSHSLYSSNSITSKYFNPAKYIHYRMHIVLHLCSMLYAIRYIAVKDSNQISSPRATANPRVRGRDFSRHPLLSSLPQQYSPTTITANNPQKQITRCFNTAKASSKMPTRKSTDATDTDGPSPQPQAQPQTSPVQNVQATEQQLKARAEGVSIEVSIPIPTHSHSLQLHYNYSKTRD
jgi:hypothetical protein